MLWWDAQDHVHVIGTGITFENLNFFLPSQRSNDFSNLHFDRTVKNFLSAFGYNDHMVFTIPDHVIL